MGLKPSHFRIFRPYSHRHTASNLLRFFQSTQKIKSNHLLHRATDHTAPHHSLTSLQIRVIRPFTSFSLSFSLPVGVGNNNYYFKSSNQTKSFTFPSLALIRSTPRLHSFKLFTSLSLFLSSLYPLATTTSRLFQSSNQTKIFTFPCL